MINFLVFIPLALGPTLYGEQILILIGQDARVSKIAHSYIIYCLPGQFFAG